MEMERQEPGSVEYGNLDAISRAGRWRVCTIDIYRFPRSLIVTSLLYVVPEADAKHLVAAPIKAKWKFVTF